MAQRFALSRTAVETAETLGDVWAEVTADGVVEVHEVTQLAPLITDVQQITLLVDAAQTHAVASMRRGATSRNADDSRVAVLEVHQLIVHRGEESALARKVQETHDAAEDGAVIEAEARNLGLTPKQYMDTLTDVVCEQLVERRKEGKRILAERQPKPAA